MRQPFYWAAREAWYVRHPDASGKLRTIRLASDETEARQAWERSFKPQPRTVADTIASMNLAPVVSKPSKAESRKAEEAARREASMCAARAREIYEREAKERMTVGVNQHTSPPANLPEGKKGDARDIAGKAFGVSGKSVDHAKPARNAQRDHARDHSPGPRESRMMQFARVLMLAELLAPLRRGASIDVLAGDVCDMMGQRYCDRTIRRDLEFLESMGVVELDHRDDGPMIARWIRGRIRSAVIEALANASSERMEGYANAPQ